MGLNEDIDKALDNIIVESRAPKVGIWWFIDGRVESAYTPARDVQPLRGTGVRDVDFNHYDYWPKLKIRGEYDSHERGRVMYKDNEDKYLIFCSTTISKNKAAIREIARTFSLPLSKIRIETDEHYEDSFAADFDALFDDD